jgi:hypothetical protein
MEVEFLSNMKYSLFTSAGEWHNWYEKLGRFGTFVHSAIKSCEASRYGLANTLLNNGLGNLPSPPTSQQASPPYIGTSHLSADLSRTTTPILLPQISSTVVSPIGPLPELDYRSSSRKRLYEDDMQESPAKRLHMLGYSQDVVYGGLSSAPPMPLPSSRASRVALPNLVIPSSNSNLATPVQLGPQLPLPGSRAMSLVYSNMPQHHQPVSRPTSIPSIPTSLPPHSMQFQDPARQLSPYPISSVNSSPVSASTYHSHLSPSFFLAQRASPYRPVRRVQTLLVPPPVNSNFVNAPRRMGMEQMQYHPLGKSLNETRVGHLPYIQHDNWPQITQYGQWPVVPSSRP